MKFFVLCAVVLLLVGSFGFSYFGMEMEGGERMTNCPFMSGQAAICTMNPLEHIAAWQNAFTASVQEKILLFLVFAAFILFFIGRLRGTNYILSAPALPIVLSPLQVAFLRGTLHPKIF